MVARTPFPGRAGSVLVSCPLGPLWKTGDKGRGGSAGSSTLPAEPYTLLGVPVTTAITHVLDVLGAVTVITTAYYTLVTEVILTQLTSGPLGLGLGLDLGSKHWSNRHEGLGLEERTKVGHPRSKSGRGALTCSASGTRTPFPGTHGSVLGTSL